MQLDKITENQRASRIALRINEDHLLLVDVYENLVDRDFKRVERDIKVLIINLKLTLKSMEDDDF